MLRKLITVTVIAITGTVFISATSSAKVPQQPEKTLAKEALPASAADITSAAQSAQIAQYVKGVMDGQVHEYLESQAYLAAQAYLASQAPRPTPQPQRTQNTSSYSNSNPGGFLSCVRQRESGGNYGIYNSGGSGAAGAYQFMQGTWNGIASSSGRSDLVGVDPAQASPADQDAMAQALYAQQGTAPWGGGC